MRRWTSILAGLLLAVWLPATLHCALETIPGFSFLQSCCGTEQPRPAAGGCADEVCSEIESGLYSIEDSPPILPSPDLLAVTAWRPAAEAPSHASFCFRPVSSTPPELPRRWQFSCRTALLPRAPSGVA